jgi:hypothetical protein
MTIIFITMHELYRIYITAIMLYTVRDYARVCVIHNCRNSSTNIFIAVAVK